MFVITLASENEKGAFSVINEMGEKVILFFEDKDDAERYSLMLNEMGIDELNIVEHEEEMLIKTCKLVGFKYSKISSHDFVIPPGYPDDTF
jgi:predicted urease superfamily metal-dependent hydrolase